jgi:hypothetical protein
MQFRIKPFGLKYPILVSVLEKLRYSVSRNKLISGPLPLEKEDFDRWL